MKEIPLTKGEVALVDDEDYKYLAKWKWHVRNSNGKLYADTTRGLGKELKISMHRLLLFPGPGEVVDHKNGDGLDNRRENIRVCLRFQNQGNMKRQEGRSSRYKGVTWDYSRKKWSARISKKNRTVNLGRFADEEDAARAYDKAALEYFGEFAVLNLNS